MFFFGQNNQEQKKQTEKLIVAIKRVEKPVLTEVQKASARERILKNVTSRRSPDLVPSVLRGFQERIRSAGNGISIPAVLAARMRARILRFVENTPVTIPARPYVRHFRAAMSGVLLLAFVMMSFFTAPFRIPVTYASSYLDEVAGDVMVLRDGRTIEARKDLAVMEGDMILTMGQSSVTVHFLDDSVSRLGENTGLEIQKLYGDPENPLVTQVKLFLKNGRVWTKVVNLIDDESSFQLKTEKAVADVPKKGAFDMLSRQDLTKVAVFDNMVDLVPANAPVDTPSKTVIAGYQAQITDGSSSRIDVTPIAAGDPEISPTTRWVAANIAKDVNYGQTLTDSAASAATVAAAVTDAGTPQQMSDPLVDQEKSYFLEHYEDLIKAEATFMRGDRREASILMRSFIRGVNNTVQKLPGLMAQDPLNAGLLKSLMQEKISAQLKDMSGFLPGDSLYPIKGALLDAQILLADNDVDRLQLRISQAEGVLLDIQQLVNQGKIDYAAALLNDYSEKTAGLVLKLDSADANELETMLNPLIVEQVQQFKELTAIEKIIADKGQTDFRKKIVELRRATLLKLLDTIGQLKGSVSPEILPELKDIYDTYLADESDRDVMAPVFEKLLGPEYGLNFIQPDSDKLPDSIGAVMIVDGEATPDVKAGAGAAAAGPVQPPSNAGGGQQPKN